MKIIIEESELTQALEVYINKLGMSTEGKTIHVTFKASRVGGNGQTAMIDIIGTEDTKELVEVNNEPVSDMDDEPDDDEPAFGP